jgi:hypothetical protein
VAGNAERRNSRTFLLAAARADQCGNKGRPLASTAVKVVFRNALLLTSTFISPSRGVDGLRQIPLLFLELLLVDLAPCIALLEDLKGRFTRTRAVARRSRR